MDRNEILALGSSHLERLTRAIRRAVALIAGRNPGCFQYHGVSLSGAVERRLYQEAVLRPASLVALSKAGSPAEDFAEWLPAKSSISVVRDTAALCKAWARLMYFGLYRAGFQRRTGKGFGQRTSDQLVSNRADIVFCVLRPRFVNFFLPVIERLGRNRCALLCETGYGVEEQASRNHLAVCEQRSDRLQVRAVSRPPGALFPLYAMGVVDLLRALGTLRRYRPRVVVFAEAASFYEEIVARAARTLGIATVRVQYGRAGVLSPGYYDMQCDRILMWGEGFVQRIKPTSPDCCYVVTGSPLLDSVVQDKDSELLDAFANTGILVTVISQPECSNISRDDYASLASIVNRVLQSNSDIKVLVRLHPADGASDFRKLARRWTDRMRVTGVEDYPLGSVLTGSTLVLGLYSTVLSEAVAYGVLPVVVRLGERHRIFPSPEDAGAAALATNPDEAVAAISRLAADPLEREHYRVRMQSFARKYFGPMDGGAVGRIATQIEELAQ